MRLTFSGGEVELRAGAGDEAQATEAVECAIDGDAIEIAFNPQYLLDGLGAPSTTPSTRLSFTTSTRPAVLTGEAPTTRPATTATCSCRCGCPADARPHPRPRRVHVAALSLTDFRCYPQVDLELRPGVTSFVGPNGQGKTNLVEAIGYLATLGSHRVATDAPLVRPAPSARSCAPQVARDDRGTLVEVEINPGRANRARINRSPVPRPREVLGAAAHGAVRTRGPRAGQGRPERAAPVPRRAARRARAAAWPACAPTTTACSSSATRC